MRLLAHPYGNDQKVVSGESGAVTAGLVDALLNDTACKDMKDEIGLNEDSVVLVFSTEGNTDPDNYRAIVG